MPQQRFKLQISLNYGKLKQNVVSWTVLMLKVALTWSWSILLHWHLISIKNDRHLLHAWLDNDYSSPGMLHFPFCSVTILYTTQSYWPAPLCAPKNWFVWETENNFKKWTILLNMLHLHASFGLVFIFIYFLFLMTLWNRCGKDQRNNISIKSGLKLV